MCSVCVCLGCCEGSSNASETCAIGPPICQGCTDASGMHDQFETANGATEIAMPTLYIVLVRNLAWRMSGCWSTGNMASLHTCHMPLKDTDRGLDCRRDREESNRGPPAGACRTWMYRYINKTPM